jgi:hypothetical protein
MPYPELVVLIDSKIARLRYARELLSTSALPEDLLSSPVVAEAAVEVAPPAIPEPAPSEPLRSVKRFLLRARRERRYVAKTKPVEQTALRSALPVGPVFVPATRLVVPQIGAAAAPAFEKHSDIPTAAQLTQRWLHATS